MNKDELYLIQYDLDNIDDEILQYDFSEYETLKHEEILLYIDTKPHEPEEIDYLTLSFASIVEDQSLNDSELEYEMDNSESHDLYHVVNYFLKRLTPREECIIRMYFGIGYSISMGVHEIASDLFLSVNRVQQILSTGLRKLKIMMKNDKYKRTYGYIGF